MRSSESTLWMKRVEDEPFESSTEKLDWIPLPPFFRFYSSSRSSLHSSAPLASLHPRMNILRSEFYRVLFKHSISFSMRMQATSRLKCIYCLAMFIMFAWVFVWCQKGWAMLCIFCIKPRQEPFLWIPSLAGPVASGRPALQFALSDRKMLLGVSYVSCCTVIFWEWDFKWSFFFLLTMSKAATRALQSSKQWQKDWETLSFWNCAETLVCVFGNYFQAMYLPSSAQWDEKHETSTRMLIGQAWIGCWRPASVTTLSPWLAGRRSQRRWGMNYSCNLFTVSQYLY